MKYSLLLVLIITIVAAIKQSALAKPSNLNPVPLSVISISNQYHAQDALGQYSYGYSNIHSSKTEYRGIDGVTRGGYSYIDAEGKLQQVQYISDAINGFRVSGTNIPVPVGLNLVQTSQTMNSAVAEDETQHQEEVEKIKARTQEEDVPVNNDLVATADGGGFIRQAIIHEEVPVSVVLNEDYSSSAGGAPLLLPAFAYRYDYQTPTPFYMYVVDPNGGGAIHGVTPSQGSMAAVEKPNEENLAKVDKSRARIQ